MKRAPSNADVTGNTQDNNEKSRKDKLRKQLTTQDNDDAFADVFNARTRKIQKTTVEESKVSKPSTSMIKEVGMEAVEEHKEDFDSQVLDGIPGEVALSAGNESYVYVENEREEEAENIKT